MASVALHYKINDAATQAKMAALENFDSYPMMDEIGAYLDATTQYRFEQGIDPDGNAWLPSKRALAEGGKTLIDHGHLRDSYTHIAASTQVEHGSNMIYSAIQHFGGPAGRNHSVTLPPRPAAGINAEDEHEISLIVHDRLRGVLS